MMLTKALIWASSLAVGVLAVPAPGACSGVCGTHDPSVIRRVSDGTYFRFSTNGHVGTASAPSISGPWTNRGAALPGAPKLPYGNDYWAPDVSLVGNTYYMYYSVSAFGFQNSGIGVATSSNLEPGSWTDHGSIGIDSREGSPYNTIDANLVKSGNDYYLNFGSFWDDIFQVRMSSDLKRAATTPKNVIYTPVGVRAIEGPSVLQNGNYFYMFFSAGKCCGLDIDTPPAGEEYMIKVCRSSSVSGPYVDKNGASCTNGGGTILLQSHDNIYAPGGQGVMNDPTHGPVLYYHYKNKDIGIRNEDALFGWNPLSFQNGWPVVVAPGTKPPTPTPTPTPTSNPGGPGPGAPLYGQCGGSGWTGPKTCAQGTCKFSNEWYSQCL